MSMYLEVVRYYSKRRSKTLKTYGFLPLDESKAVANLATDFLFDNFPREFHHQIARDFWIYCLAKDLILQFNGLYLFAKMEIATTNETLKYEEGRSYPHTEDERIQLEYRMRVQDQYTPCSVILMTNYFVLLREAVVEKRVHYDELMPLADKSDHRRIFLGGERDTIWLQLKDASVAQAFLTHLEESRSVLMRYKLSQLVKEVEFFRAHCE